MSGLMHRGLPLVLTADDFAAAAAAHFGWTVEDMRGRRRAMPLARHRQIGMAAAAGCPHLSLPAIGRAFDRDHTTVLYACRLRERAWHSAYLDMSIAAVQAKAIRIAMDRVQEGAE